MFEREREIPQHLWLQGLYLRYSRGLSGLSNLGNSRCSVLYLYINMAPGPHRLGISALCLFTSSIVSLSALHWSKSSSRHTFSPEASSGRPSRRSIATLQENPQTAVWLHMVLIWKCWPYIKLIVHAGLQTVKKDRKQSCDRLQLQ